jgi:hypothetical protein
VALDDSGSFLVTWKRGDVYHLRYDALLGRVCDASGIGAPEFAMAESTTLDAGTVWARQAQADGTLGPAATLNGEPGGSPALAAAPEGGFVAAWTGQDGSGGGAFARRFEAEGRALDPEFRLSSWTTCQQGDASVAVDARGDAFAVWLSGLSEYSPDPEPRQDGHGTGIFGQSLADALFANGFDSGDLSGWSATSTDGGDLRAVPRLDGEGHPYALQALIDDPAPLYVQDDSPDHEGHYRAFFEFDPRGFDSGEANGAHRVRVFLGLESQPTRRAFSLVLRRLGGDYALRARVRLEDGSRADTPFVPIASGPHRLELRWARATRPHRDDGFFALWIDDALAARLDALDNPSPGIESVRLGALSVKGGASGGRSWDSFVSRRWSPIGPAAN